ncbi:terpene synthase family protein [Frankia sp. AgKG'84/4]|uniref:terpene synthase family protein n=1 Tax=Frankia sp. AgKG'84/4 TaxID=573490 RepID=UPI00200D12EE|nr:terpene cyclase [Frankia sp. AgKG'84/4]MCL9796392.1 terpene cyclase [Frankia sp. AgKG'84/4]
MPQDVAFDLPFPLRVHQGMESVVRRNLDWVRRYGLVGGERSVDWYTSWDMPRLAAYGFPDATGPGLELCTDVMAFFFVFDDQLDGPLGLAPDEVARVCQGLIDIVHGTGQRSGEERNPCSAAFADLWRRSTDGACAGWVARVTGEWEYYFAAHAHEAVSRRRGVPADLEQYLEVRRGIAGTALPLSLGERAAGLTLPAAVFHSPQLRLMREIAIDITLMCNDVFSLEKEEARGDMDNLVLVLEHTRQCTRAQAIAAAREEVHRRCARFQELAGEVPLMCAHLALSGEQRESVATYVDGLTAWISGYHAWETETLRYTTALEILPRSGPGYFENVLGKPASTRS